MAWKIQIYAYTLRGSSELRRTIQLFVSDDSQMQYSCGWLNSLLLYWTTRH